MICQNVWHMRIREEYFNVLMRFCMLWKLTQRVCKPVARLWMINQVNRPINNVEIQLITEKLVPRRIYFLVFVVDYYDIGTFRCQKLEWWAFSIKRKAEPLYCESDVGQGVHRWHRNYYTMTRKFTRNRQDDERAFRSIENLRKVNWII